MWIFSYSFTEVNLNQHVLFYDINATKKLEFQQTFPLGPLNLLLFCTAILQSSNGFSESDSGPCPMSILHYSKFSRNSGCPCHILSVIFPLSIIKLDGVASLITNPPPTSSIIWYKKKKKKKNYTQHLTLDT